MGVAALAVLATTPTSWAQPGWVRQPTPNRGHLGDDLAGVAALSPTDIWAVGSFALDTGNSHTLVEHSDGTTWTRVKSPNPHTASSQLVGAAADSPDDVWAVGFSDLGDGRHTRTLIEHEDGTGWVQVPSANPDKRSDILEAVAALSPTDLWAVGGARRSALIEHDDGTGWSAQAVPRIGQQDRLTGVSATSSTDVWAVGYAYMIKHDTLRTIVLHNDGTGWTISPTEGGSNARFFGVDALSATNVWAVGAYTPGPPGSRIDTLVEHFDGTSWSVVPSPNANGGTVFQAIGGTSPSDLWAVGYSFNGPTTYTLVEHWNGAGWSIQASPSHGANNELLGVAAPATTSVVAVGYRADTIASAQRTLALHCC